MKWLSEIFKRWKTPEKETVAPPTNVGPRSPVAARSVTGAITPERLTSILGEAEDGDILAQCELFEEMEKRDPEFLGLVGQRKAGVLACKYVIEPGDEKDKRSVAAAEFCQKIMDDLDSIEDGDNLQDNMFDVLDAIPKGFSCLEVIWDTSEKNWWPTRLEFRPQRWWNVDRTDRNKLLLRDADNWQGVEVNPLNFIVHRHRGMSGTLAQCGLALACARPFVVRNYSLKDWLVMSELFGMPTRVGTLPQGATEADAAALLTALQNLGVAAYGVKPFGSDIEFTDAAGKTASADLYERLFDKGGHMYAIALLGQTLTSGGEGGGSYALGQVHQNVRYDLVDSDARRTDRRWSAFYARITMLNFGPDVAPPKHRTIVEEPKDLTGLANVVNILVQAGAKIPVAWTHDTFGIPEPEDGEETLKPAAAANPLAGLGGLGFGNAIENSVPVSGEKKNFAPPRNDPRFARSARWLG